MPANAAGQAGGTEWLVIRTWLTVSLRCCTFPHRCRPPVCLHALNHPLQVPMAEKEPLGAYLEDMRGRDAGDPTAPPAEPAAANKRRQGLERARLRLYLAHSDFTARLAGAGGAGLMVFLFLSRLQRPLPAIAGTGMVAALAAALRFLVRAIYWVVAALMVPITVWFCDGLAELILAALAYLQALRNTFK